MPTGEPLELLLSVDGPDAERHQRALRDWLSREQDLRGRVTRRHPAITPGEMGALDVLGIAVGSGAALTVLAGSLAAWLTQRGGNIRIRVTVTEQRKEIVVDAHGVRDFSALVRDLRELTRADPARSGGNTGDQPSPGTTNQAVGDGNRTAQVGAVYGNVYLGGGRSAPGPPDRFSPPPQRFPGRTAELETLTALARRAGRRGRPLVVAISGTGGIGKTSLARRWARQHADEFPDGQLYVDLRGLDPSGPPVSAEAAVRGFLDGPGADPAGYGPARSREHREPLADRRMLIILDNARDADQLRRLLPGGPPCAVLIVSRHQFPPLYREWGVDPLPLDAGPEPAARDRPGD